MQSVWKELLKLFGLQPIRHTEEETAIFGRQTSRSWFRITIGEEVTQGTILNGQLQLSIRFQGEEISTRMSEEHARKLLDWMQRQYPPHRPPPVPGLKNNVVRLLPPNKR